MTTSVLTFFLPTQVRSHSNKDHTFFFALSIKCLYSLFIGKSGSYNTDEPLFKMFKAAEDHPFVVKGCKRSTSRRRRGDGGGSCVSFDLPGVCSDDILVLPNENEVKFYGENKEVYEHDDSCRIFMGAITRSSVCAPGVPLLSHDIAWDAEFGVLTVRVSPPGSNNTNRE